MARRDRLGVLDDAEKRAVRAGHAPAKVPASHAPAILHAIEGGRLVFDRTIEPPQ